MTRTCSTVVQLVRENILNMPFPSFCFMTLLLNNVFKVLLLMMRKQERRAEYLENTKPRRAELYLVIRWEKAGRHLISFTPPFPFV